MNDTHLNVFCIPYFCVNSRRTVKIAIVGRENVGTQFAVHCEARNYKTIIYSSKP